MDRNSKSEVVRTLEEKVQKKDLPEKIGKTLLSFYESYCETVKEPKQINEIFLTFIELVEEQCKKPYVFEPYHKQIRKPFDYYKFGLDFIRPLVDMSQSTVNGEKHLQEIEHYLQQGDNVIFLANHQTEADPQALSLLLEKDFPKLTGKMIFVAGERVITDPLAVPFSMGCNLLCIYSKRYIDFPLEKKLEKQLHNKKTMQLMSTLLKEGGKCIYVAPSGGRDRKDAEGNVQIAPFDPQSIEMFYLMAKRAKTPTHFYPMALKTYECLPPPETIQTELGELRLTNRIGIHLSIGQKIDMEHYPGNNHFDKHVRRKSRADYIWNLVRNDYNQFPG